MDLQCLTQSPKSHVLTWRANLREQSWCIRLFSPVQQSRVSQEIQCMHIADQLAPKILWIDAEQGVTILEWLPGRHLQCHDYQNVELVIQHLHRLHQLDASGLKPCTSTMDRIQNFLCDIPLSDYFANLIPQCEVLTRQLTAEPFARGFVHNDLHAKNTIIHNENIKWIDWSEAGSGDIGNDLAEILIFLPHQEHEDFIKSYCGAVPTHKMQRALKRHWLLRLGLFAAWGLAQAQGKENTSKQEIPVDSDVFLRMILSGEQVLQSAADYHRFAEIMMRQFLASS